jgi:predicted dithiol-disulfide oxidoreductase (DUF899 family)
MMTITDSALPELVSHDEWLAARKALLAKEKARRRRGPGSAVCCATTSTH